MPQDTTTAHSLLGASSMSRWSVCAGSYILENIGLAEEGDTSFADIGSDAHDIAAECLRDGKELWEFYADARTENVDLAALSIYVDYINQLRRSASKYSEWIEKKIFISEDLRGTVDYAISFTNEKMLEIVDYKNGTGVFVDVVDNAQCKYYAWLLISQRPKGSVEYTLANYPDYKIRLTVVQPNYFGAAPVRSWDIPLKDLMDWANNVLLPSVYTLKGRTEYTIEDFSNGSHCQFCKVMLDCPLIKARYEQFKNLSTGRTVEDMNSAELDMLYDSVDNVQTFIKKMKFAVEGRLLTGETFKNAKLVEKRATSRNWREGADKALVSAFGTGVFTKPELKSPAVVEKEFAGAKTLTAEWAFTPESGGVTVAHISDRRPAVANNKESVKEVFGDFNWNTADY